MPDHRSLLLFLTLAAIFMVPASAHAYSYPGERPAPELVQGLARKADAFWHKRNVPACASTRTVLMAPSLLDADGVDAVGRALRDDCQTWVTGWLVTDTANPDRYGTALDLCFAVYHEAGHTGGLAHSDTGLMKDKGGTVPFECRTWARHFEDRKYARQARTARR